MFIEINQNGWQWWLVWSLSFFVPFRKLNIMLIRGIKEEIFILYSSHHTAAAEVEILPYNHRRVEKKEVIERF